MNEKVSFLKRLQKARLELSELNLEKTGYNSYSKYKYWELGDFLPYVIRICDKYSLFTDFQIDINNEVAKLLIIDSEDEVNQRAWETKISKMQLKGCNEMQNIQGTHTSAKKILYLAAFEIAEGDLGEINKQQEELEDEGNNLIGLEELEELKRLVEATNTALEAMYSTYKIKSFQEMTNKQYVHALKVLYKKLDKKKVEDKANQLSESKNLEQSNKQIVFGGNR